MNCSWLLEGGDLIVVNKGANGREIDEMQLEPKKQKGGGGAANGTMRMVLVGWMDGAKGLLDQGLAGSIQVRPTLCHLKLLFFERAEITW